MPESPSFAGLAMILVLALTSWYNLTRAPDHYAGKYGSDRVALIWVGLVAGILFASYGLAAAIAISG